MRRVADALTERGAERAAAGIRVLPDAATTALLAATQLGVDVGAIANSLVFDADGAALLILTSGAHRVDTARIAGLIGVTKVRRASPELVRAATGQPIGGVAPVGHPEPVRTLVDVTLAVHPVVWAGAGIPHTVFPTNYAELLQVTSGVPVEVT